MVSDEFNLKAKYFNCGSLAPIPKSSISKMRQNTNLLVKNPCSAKATNILIEIYHGLKSSMSKFLETQDNSLAYFQSTNVGISTILGSLDWNEQDEIIIGKNEYIDAILPFYALKENFGVKIKRVENSDLLQGINELMSDRVKLVFFSHVEWNTGTENNFRSISSKVWNRENIMIMVDGAQAVGQIHVKDLDSIDFYIFPFHKWMLGPVGTGLAYISPKRLDCLKPLSLNSIGASLQNNNKVVLRDNARVLENSSFNHILYSAVLNNIKLIESIGIDQINCTITELADFFYSRLCEIGAATSKNLWKNNGMVFWHNPQNMNCLALSKILEKHNFYCKTIPEENILRFCFHIYNSKDEIEQLCQFLIESEVIL